MGFVYDIGIMLCIYIILVLSANLIMGMANLLTMCQAAFYGMGAYIGAQFLIHFDLPFAVVALIVMVVTGLTSLVVSLASVKLKDDYFILTTLGFQMIVYTILNNWIKETPDGKSGGPFGIHGIPRIELFGRWSLSSNSSFFFFTLVVAALAMLVFGGLQHSPYGRVLKAIRTDELSVKALGRDTARMKAWAFFISAAFTGLAGVIYVSYRTDVFLTSFTLDECIFIITALFVGGAGSRVRGPVLGAAVVVLLPELLKFFGLPKLEAGFWKQVIYGFVLVVLMLFRPQGLLGDSKWK